MLEELGLGVGPYTDRFEHPQRVFLREAMKMSAVVASDVYFFKFANSKVSITSRAHVDK